MFLQCFNQVIIHSVKLRTHRTVHWGLDRKTKVSLLGLDLLEVATAHNYPKSKEKRHFNQLILFLDVCYNSIYHAHSILLLK